jgi:CRISPR-associated protein Cmr5
VSGQNGSGQTLSQRRARFALDRVRAVVGKEYEAAFRSYAASLPPMIQMNGFGQALAFCRSKSEQAYQELYRLVSDWLTSPGQPYQSHKDVLDGITKEGMSSYRLAQTEALALLDWVKRFASAFIARRRSAGDGSAVAVDATTAEGRGSS